MDSARGTACSLHAGELVQAQSGRRMGIRTKISGRDIVSDTGLAVERLLVGSITVGRPDGALLTMETGVHGGNGPARRLLGPIDCTTSVVHGLRGFAVSNAAQVAGRTVVAAIGDASTTRPS
jgi:fructose-1,6-bisphosphatase/inositol monophosphatase family enzyme